MEGDRAIEEERLERAIAAQDGLRGVVPDEIVNASIAALRQQWEQSRPDGRRRTQVTVLFADVSGFTTMSSRLDAELVAGLMNDLWSRLDTVVVEHGGRIDKHTGDAVMAVWGATSTQEDDAERTVSAALALQEAAGPAGARPRRTNIVTLRPSRQASSRFGSAAPPQRRVKRGAARCG